MDFALNKNYRLGYCIVIAVIILSTVVAYLPLWSNGFINFDDGEYIFDNPFVQQGLTWESTRWAFTFSSKISFWHPVTWLSLMLDYELFGLDPRGYHLVNLLLHMGNAILLFHLLNLMTKRFWPSTWVAILFAIHPVNVESVAWAAERKNVLSVFFFMLTIWAYRHYVQNPSLKRYLLVLVTMTVGLMAKPLLVSLPFLLLLLDFWPMARMQLSALISAGPGRPNFSIFGGCSLFTLALEKVPLLVLSVLSVMISIRSNATLMKVVVPMTDRIDNAFVSYVGYICKMFWPSGLAFYYPLQTFPLWKVVGAALLLILISLASVRLAGKRPWLTVGWIWYLMALFPLIGLVRGGLWPAMADRYAYLPYIGLFMILAWEGCGLWEKLKDKRLLLLVTGGGVAALMVCTYAQTGLWRDSITLFDHATKVTERNAIAHVNLGTGYIAGGNLVGGISNLKEAIKINPSLEQAHFNLGNAYLKLGQLNDAHKCYSRSLSLNEKVDKTHVQLGIVLDKMNRPEEALPHFIVAFELNPRNVDALWLMANVLAQQRNYDRAIVSLKQLVSIEPADVRANVNLGSLLALTAQYEESAIYFRKALQIDPQNQLARQNLELLRVKGH